MASREARQAAIKHAADLVRRGVIRRAGNPPPFKLKRGGISVAGPVERPVKAPPKPRGN